MRADLEQLFIDITADNLVDVDEVEQLKTAVYGDDVSPGVVDREEANFLFELNDAVSDSNNCPEYTEFIKVAIAEHVTADPDSPGEIDADEAAWLIEKFGADGKVDDVEKAIMAEIKARASKIDQSLIDYIAVNG